MIPKEKAKVKAKDKMEKRSGSSGSDSICHNCGKKGHKAAECWSKKREQDKGNQKGNNKGKKHVSGLEHGGSAEVGAEPAPEADVGQSEVGVIGTPTAEAAAVEEEWVKFSLDTGAAQTAVL